MTNTLTLNPSGAGGCTPEPNPWKPKKGSEVQIINNSGFDQELKKISSGLLQRLTLPKYKVLRIENGKEWKGRVGNIRGDYIFDDGLASAADIGTRTGTIDPS